MKLSSRIKIFIATAVVSITIIALAFEFYLEIENRHPSTQVRLVTERGVDFDTRDELDEIAELRRQGIEVRLDILPPLENDPNGGVRSVIEPSSEPRAIGGIADRMTVLCNLNGEYLTYRSDEHGFHNPAAIWQSARLDIAVVGNSYTMGYCVPSDRNFVSLIRNRHPSTLNLAMAGQGPLGSLAAITEYLQYLKPKTVLWFYSENNFEELQQWEKQSLLIRYMERDFSQGLLHQQSEINQTLSLYMQGEIEKRRIKGEVERRRIRRMKQRVAPSLFDGFAQTLRMSAIRQHVGLIQTDLPIEDATVDLYRHILSEANTRVQSWGGKLRFIYLPRPGLRHSHNGTNILEFVKGLGVPITDVVPVFEAENDPSSLFSPEGARHYNEAGHRLVAQKVLADLDAETKISPQ